MCCNYSAILVYSIGTVATVPKVTFFFFGFFFQVIGLCFFFIINFYMGWHMYCYTNTTNFTIFSQLLRCTDAL